MWDSLNPKLADCLPERAFYMQIRLSPLAMLTSLR
jgi:hypothetical protein